MQPRPQRKTVPVIGTPIDAVDWDTALARIDEWGLKNDSRYVCICNVHSLVTARQQPAFARALAQADMTTPDGAPVAWMLRRLGMAGQERINGPDLMLRYCERAQRSGVAIFLYGSTAEMLMALQSELRRRFPALRIAGSHAPPFRPPTPAETQSEIDQINGSGAGVVFVSLGCPKQEMWMAERSGHIRAVTIGVGAAFAFHAGITRRAPAWMHSAGLEWLHRLAQEPRRLWRRYLVTNSVFIVQAAIQLLQGKAR
jgi:N-acetylglucosaminyldiphosphoundecaprenol N-acetyl-beta-D-mannosaminyltransferase